jgi:hypothetical protein
MGLSFPSRREGVGLSKVAPASRPKRLYKSVDILLDKRMPFALDMAHTALRTCEVAPTALCVCSALPLRKVEKSILQHPQ